MRWRYVDPTHDPDSGERARVTAAIDRLWSELAERNADILGYIRGAGRFDLPGWLTPRTFFRRTKEELVPLDGLEQAVGDAIAHITGALPAGPYRAPPEDQATGAVFQLHGPELDDYPGWSDLIVASSAWPEIFSATHAPGFSSARFSRVGETFCYLKVDGREGLPDGWPDRGYLEDQVCDLLEDNDAGTVLAGGTGRIYSYVELVLRDVEVGAGLVSERLRRSGIHERTWILFHDPELRAEWIGVHPDTPPPP